MGSRRWRYEWPVYTAAVVFLVGRVILWVGWNYEKGGAGGVIAYVVSVAAITPFVVWLVRRGQARQRR